MAHNVCFRHFVPIADRDVDLGLAGGYADARSAHTGAETGMHRYVGCGGGCLAVDIEHPDNQSAGLSHVPCVRLTVSDCIATLRLLLCMSDTCSG
jgi:hypothetical protein